MSVERSLMKLDKLIALREAPMADLPIAAGELCDRDDALSRSKVDACNVPVRPAAHPELCND